MGSILALINLALPNVVNLVLAIRHKDGSATVTVILNEADAQFATNQQQVADWFKAHPGLTPPPAPPAA